MMKMMKLKHQKKNNNIIYYTMPNIFKKLDRGANNFFKKLPGTVNNIAKKVDGGLNTGLKAVGKVADKVANGLEKAAPIIAGGIGLATGNPELGLAAAEGLSQLQQGSKLVKRGTVNATNGLNKANIVGQTNKVATQISNKGQNALQNLHLQTQAQNQPAPDNGYTDGNPLNDIHLGLQDN